jgi:hypothetical protein
MIQLGVVLGAYKASSAVTYVFVRWIMRSIGFQLMLPIIMIASALLAVYAWSPYIDRYKSEVGQGSTDEVATSPTRNRTEVSGDVAPEPSSSATNTRQNDGNQQPESTETQDNGNIRQEIHQSQAAVLIDNYLDVYLAHIRKFLGDHVKLLKAAYFLGMFATGFVDPLALPRKENEEPPWDRVCPFNALLRRH